MGRTGPRGLVCLLLASSLLLATACTLQADPTQRWVPPYLQVSLRQGTAACASASGFEWTAHQLEAGIHVEDTVSVTAGESEGARFLLGDGSVLGLVATGVMQLRNMRTFPRLQVTVEKGSLAFAAEEPSYEFNLPDGTLTLLSVPARLAVQVSPVAVLVIVEDGTASYAYGSETVALAACRVMVLKPGQSPVINKSCVHIGLDIEELAPSLQAEEDGAGSSGNLGLIGPDLSWRSFSTAAPVPTRPPGGTATATRTATPTATPTVRAVLRSPTPTAVPPTATPVPQSGGPSKPKPPTAPPPTAAPPTAVPATQPPPTSEPRPTPKPPRPTPEPPPEPPPGESPPEPISEAQARVPSGANLSWTKWSSVQPES